MPTDRSALRTLAKQHGMSFQTLYARVAYQNMTPEEAVAKPTAPLSASHRAGPGYMRRNGSPGRKFEHVEVAERALGRMLPKGAVVHHANGLRDDNRPENLVICPSHAYHKLLHRRMRARDACGNPNGVRCQKCGQWDIPCAGFKERQDGRTGGWHIGPCPTKREKR